MDEAEQGLFRARLESGTRMVVVTQELFESTMKEIEEERDRARALAAKLEEVVAMRTVLLKALVDWRTADGKAGSETQLNGIVTWAHAQLSEVP